MNKRFVVIKNKHLSAVLGRSSTLTPQQVVYLVSCQQSNVTSLGDPSSLTLLGGLSLTQEKRNRGKWHRKGETSSHFEAPLWFLCRAAPPWDKRPLCVAQAGGCRGVLWDWGGGSPSIDLYSPCCLTPSTTARLTSCLLYASPKAATKTHADHMDAGISILIRLET